MSKREFEYGDPCYCDQCSASSWYDDRIEERTEEVRVAVKLANGRGWRYRVSAAWDGPVCLQCQGADDLGSLRLARELITEDFLSVIECDVHDHLAIECECGDCIETELTSLRPPMDMDPTREVDDD